MSGIAVAIMVASIATINIASRMLARTSGLCVVFCAVVVAEGISDSDAYQFKLRLVETGRRRKHLGGPSLLNADLFFLSRVSLESELLPLFRSERQIVLELPSLIFGRPLNVPDQLRLLHHAEQVGRRI